MDCEAHESEPGSKVTDPVSIDQALNRIPVCNLDQIIDLERYSSLGRLQQITCYMLRFLHLIKFPDGRRFPLITELLRARQKWSSSVQQDVYSTECNLLQKLKVVKNSLIRHLRLFLDQHGLIRCGGRFANAPVPAETNYSILRPMQHHYTYLIIMYSHTALLHAGVEVTVASTRQSFWIPHIRRVVKCV